MKKPDNERTLMYGLAVYADPWDELQKRTAIKVKLEQVRRLHPEKYQETIVDLSRALGQTSVDVALAAIAHEAGDDRSVIPPIGA